MEQSSDSIREMNRSLEDPPYLKTEANLFRRNAIAQEARNVKNGHMHSLTLSEWKKY